MKWGACCAIVTSHRYQIFTLFCFYKIRRAMPFRVAAGCAADARLKWLILIVQSF